MRHLKIFVLTAAVLIGLSACTAEKTDDESVNSVNDLETAEDFSGTYDKAAVSLEDNFSGGQCMLYDNGYVYLIGRIKDNSETPSIACAVINTADMSAEYMSVPVEGNIKSMAKLGDSYLYAVSEYDSATSTSVYNIYCIKDGEIQWKVPFSGTVSLPEFFFDKVYVSSDGTKCYAGADTSLAVISADGTVEEVKALPDAVKGVDCDNSGTLHVWGKTFHYTMDSTGNLTENSLIQSMMKKYAANGYCFLGEGYDCYFTNETGLYGYDTESDAVTPLMNWVNSGIVSNNNMLLAVASPDMIFCYGNNGLGGTNGLWKYTKSDGETVNQKEIVKITYIENGTNKIPLAAVKFNEAQSKYHVECCEYSSNVDSNGELSVFDALDMAILQGNAGDIVVTDNIDSMQKYAQKNLFADLYELIAADGELSKEDIFGCVRQAFEIDGRLYGIPREFVLRTLACKADKIDSNTIWNTKSFIDYSGGLSGQQAIYSMTQNGVYNALKNSVLSECIDFENSTCSFDSGTFAEFLNYYASMPQNDESGYEYGQNVYITDEVALYDARIGSYAEYAQMMNVFGGDAAVKAYGYPSAAGGCAKIEANNVYSIMESSSVKEGATAFLKYLLSSECTVDEMRGMRTIPALKTSMRGWEESEGRMYYYFYLDNVGRYSGDESPMTEEKEGVPGVCVKIDEKLMNEMYDFIDTARVFPYIPQAVIDIVDEEISTFLGTGKSSEETAKVVQRRVSLYFDERK